MTNEMKLDNADEGEVEIKRAPRLGPEKQNKPRPIIVKLSKW